MIVYYIFLLLSVYMLAQYRDKRKAGFCMAALCFVLGSFRPAFEFLYIQMDVGQGDCACLFQNEKTYLIDGGSTSEKEIGKYRIAKMLKYYGRNDIDAVFVTHGDEDHVNGIEDWQSGRKKKGLRFAGSLFRIFRKKKKDCRSLYRR